MTDVVIVLMVLIVMMSGKKMITTLVMITARCSSVVRAFARGAMGHRIDPSW